MPPREKDGPPRPSLDKKRLTIGRLALLVVAAGYAALAFVSLYRPDPGDGMGRLETFLTWVSLMGVTFLPHAGVALAVGLVACVCVRARKTALVGVPLLALSLGPWATTFAPARGTGAPPDAESLLVLSANLLGPSGSDVELLDQIAEHNPDVILLQEVRPESHARMAAALADRYTSVAAPREHLFGGAIFSRLRFTREPEIVLPYDGVDLPQVMAWVEWDGRELCVWDIHLLPPTGRSLIAGQATFAAEMGPIVDRVLAGGADAIVAGDFNAPWRAQPLDALRGRGFREGFRTAGVGPGSSWPARGLLSLPPGIRIDHVAFTPGLACIEAWVGEVTSSDHRPNFARFVWAE